MNTQLGIDFNEAQGEKLTYEERHVLSLLEPGKDSAHSVRWLADMVGVSQLRLREIVRHLIDVHGACIGSSTGNPPGYYIIDCPKELDRVYESLKRRGISIIARAAKIKKISITEVFGQGEL